MTLATHFVGVAIMIGSTVSLAAQNLFIRKGTDTGRAYDAVLVVMLTNLTVLLPAVAVIYDPDYGIRSSSIISFVAAGLTGTMPGRAFKYFSIVRIGASRTEPIIMTNALVATILGVFLLGETISSVQMLAILAIVGGVGLIIRETTQDESDGLSGRQRFMNTVIPIAGAVAYGIEPVFASYGLGTGTPAAVGVVLKTVAALIGFLVYLGCVDALPSVRETASADFRYFLLAGLSNPLFVFGYYTALALAPVSLVVPTLPTSTLFTVVLAAVFIPRSLEKVTPRLVGVVIAVVAGAIVITVAA